MSVELYINTRTWELTVNDETIELGISVGYPTYEVATQAEAEAGTETELRAFSPVRIAQAIAALESGDTPPGGSTTQLQFNDAGAFGGMLRCTWNKSTNTLILGTSTINLGIGGRIYTGISSGGNRSGTYQIDVSVNNDCILTAIGDLNIQLAGLVAGMGGLIVLKVDATGGYTITLDAGSFTAELNGSDTIDNSANAKNLISWWYDGTYVYYSVTNTA